MAAPTYNGGGTLFVDSEGFRGSAGSWSVDAGEITYEWSLTENGIEVDSGTGNSPRGLGNYNSLNKRYQFLVRASDSEGVYDETLGPEEDGYELVAYYGLEVHIPFEDNMSRLYYENIVATEHLEGVGQLIEESNITPGMAAGFTPSVSAGGDTTSYSWEEGIQTLSLTNASAGHSRSCIDSGAGSVPTSTYLAVIMEVRVDAIVGDDIEPAIQFGELWRTDDSGFNKNAEGWQTLIMLGFAGAEGNLIIGIQSNTSGNSATMSFRNIRSYTTEFMGEFQDGGSSRDNYIGIGDGPGNALANAGSNITTGEEHYMYYDQEGPTGTSPWSISIWFKTDPNPLENGLMYWGGGDPGEMVLLTIEDSGTIFCDALGGRNISWGRGYNDNEWHHLVLAKPESGFLDSIRCYVDGALLQVASLGINEISIGTGETFILGRGYESGKYEGAVSDMRVYRHTLSFSDISQLYSLGVTPVNTDGIKRTVDSSYSASYVSPAAFSIRDNNKLDTVIVPTGRFKRQRPKR